MSGSTKAGPAVPQSMQKRRTLSAKKMVHCNFISETVTHFKESFWELKLAENHPVEVGGLAFMKMLPNG